MADWLQTQGCLPAAGLSDLILDLDNAQCEGVPAAWESEASDVEALARCWIAVFGVSRRGMKGGRKHACSFHGNSKTEVDPFLCRRLRIS